MKQTEKTNRPCAYPAHIRNLRRLIERLGFSDVRIMSSDEKTFKLLTHAENNTLEVTVAPDGALSARYFGLGYVVPDPRGAPQAPWDILREASRVFGVEPGLFEQKE